MPTKKLQIIGSVYELPAAGEALGGVKTGGDVTIDDGVITVNRAENATYADQAANALWADVANESAFTTSDSDGNIIISTYETKNDATVKANTAESNAKTYADGLNTAMQSTVNGVDARVKTLEETIIDKADNFHTHDEYLQTTDANVIKKGDILQTSNNFGNGKRVYISKIDDSLYAADKRYAVTTKIYNKTDGSLVSTLDSSVLFDGSFENTLIIQAGKYAVINISSENLSSGFLSTRFPYGSLVFSHYHAGAPEEVRCRVYCNYESQGVGWHDLEVTDYSTNSLVKKATNSYFNISQIEITVVAKDDSNALLSEIEWFLTRPYIKDSSVVSKYESETLYYPLTAPSFIGDLTGTATKSTQDDAGNVITSTYETKVDATAKFNEIKTYIDTMEFITVEDIDTICGTTVQVATASEVTF